MKTIRYTHNRSERQYTSSPIYEETTDGTGHVKSRIIFVSPLPKAEGDKLSIRIARLLNINN